MQITAKWLIGYFACILLSFILFSKSSFVCILRLLCFLPAMTAACLHGRKEVVQYVLEEGADIAATNSKSFPPLLCAVKSGKWEIADTLLLAGADIEQTDKYGRSPLMIAASEGHLGVLEMLVGWGFSMN